MNFNRMIIDLCKDKDVLDVGCNYGYGSLLFKGYRKYFGIDNNKNLIRYANGRFKRKNSSFKEEDAEKMDINFKVDVILCLDVLEHLPHPEKFIKRSKITLRKGGILIISTPDRENAFNHLGRTPKYHISEMSFKELKSMLLKYFKHIEFYSYDTQKEYNEKKVRRWEFIEEIKKYIPYFILKYYFDNWNIFDSNNFDVHNFNPNDTALFVVCKK